MSREHQMNRLTRREVMAASAALALTTVQAQQSRIVTLVVPFPAGGSTDALARLLQPKLQSRFSQTVMVENKAGAAGALGAAQVARSAPDGSTLLVTFDSHAVIPAILQRPPLDVEKDLVPVSLVGTAPYVIATSRQKPYRSFADIVAAAKDKPGGVTYASVGIGTIGHLAMTLLAAKAGVQLTHVPYRGGGPAMNDLIGGHVDLICGSAALITPQIGRTVRAIMQTGREKLDVMKDVQTATDAGFAGFEAIAWWGIFAPAGTPPPLITSLSKAINDSLSEQETTQQLRETQQMSLVLGDSAVFADFFAEQVKFWGSVVREHNIRA
jgi:tripartite-type tricarboxylate transporter receptor subunit TctC